MRNYIAELNERGYSLQRLAEETGLSKSTLSNIRHGKRALKSSERVYEIIRNANRRLGYQELRRSGISAREANAERRQILAEREAPLTDTVREVKWRQDTTRYQLYIYAEFYNPKTKERRYVKSASMAHLDKDYERDLGEAIQNARGKLNDSNWELKRIIEREYIEYRLNETGATEVQP